MTCYLHKSVLNVSIIYELFLKKKNQKIKKLDQKIIRARIIILLLILIFIHQESYNKSINSR